MNSSKFESSYSAKSDSKPDLFTKSTAPKSDFTKPEFGSFSLLETPKLLSMSKGRRFKQKQSLKLAWTFFCYVFSFLSLSLSLSLYVHLFIPFLPFLLSLSFFTHLFNISHLLFSSTSGKVIRQRKIMNKSKKN